MARVNDLGGSPGGPIEKDQHSFEDWERLTDAITAALGMRGLLSTDEHRRAQESLPPERYEALSYYERWAAATELLLVEKGILTHEEIDERSAEIERRWGGS